MSNRNIVSGDCEHVRVLLTAFGPFPGVPENPTMLAAEALVKERWSPPDASLRVEILPVEWSLTAERLPALLASGFHAALLTGVAARSPFFRVEHTARNRIQAAVADSSGETRSGAVFAGAPDLRTSAPAALIASKLRKAGLAARQSGDAGGYLCNFAYYHALRAAQQAECLFLHMPPHPACTGEAAPFAVPLEQHILAMKTTLTELALRARRRCFGGRRQE
jgi:pyroglutamyl-peptidase